MKTSSKLAAALRAHVANVHPAADRRVSQDDIAAYLEGALTGEERDRIEAAISLDPEAAEVARDFALFDAAPPAPGEPGHLTREQLASDWEEVRKRLPSTVVDGGRPPRSALAGLAVAASLLLVLGASLWGLWQRNGRLAAEERLAAALAPQLNVEPQTLWQSSTRGAAPEEPRAEPVAARGDAIWLRLAVDGRLSHEAYRLEVRALDRPGEELLWKRDGLTLYADGTFSVVFPRAAMPPGTYELRVVGVDSGAEQPVASYRIRMPAAAG